MAGADPRRRGKEWVSVGHGIRVPKAQIGQPLAGLRAWQPVLPGSAVFAGLTALGVHGLELPANAARLPIFVAAGTEPGEAMPARPELIVARHPVPPAYVLLDGVRVQPVEHAILEAARWLAPLDLIALIDSAVHLRTTAIRRLEAVARHRRRGNRMLRYALGLSDGRAESSWESYLRVLHVVGGVAVTPQVRVLGRDGRQIARADLMIDGTRTLHEYDGEHHRRPEQHRKDLRRLADLTYNGFTCRAFVAPDLLYRPERILAMAYDALGQAPPHRAAAGWRRMVSESLLTQSGLDSFVERAAGRSPQLRIA